MLQYTPQGPLSKAACRALSAEAVSAWSKVYVRASVSVQLLGNAGECTCLASIVRVVEIQVPHPIRIGSCFGAYEV